MTATDDAPPAPDVAADPSDAAASPAPSFSDLPPAVQHRVVTRVAAALPEVAVLPAPLRRVRDFAPARRARAGAAAIAAALADDDFRARVAAVAADTRDQTDPAARAAALWLQRDDGWAGRLREALEALVDLEETAGRVDPDHARRLEQRLESADEALREARTRHREETEELRAENARLRRTLGDERRTARGELERLRSEAEAVRRSQQEAEAALAAGQRELRQLQARLTRVEEDAGAVRRTARAERDDATLRARLLLDTVLDAAGGLRRELALPPATGTPGERVERGLVSDGTREPSAAGSLGGDSPGLLDHYLAMPRARLVVDGYNVTKSEWGSSSLEAQRHRLLRALAPLVARTGAETTVVFDAHQAGSRPVVAGPRGVRVAFSPEGVIADDVIRDLVEAEPTGRVVVVITGDAELAGDVRRDGARVCAPRSLLGLLSS